MGFYKNLMNTSTESINHRNYFGFEGIRQGFVKTIPLSFSIATYGLLFGILAGQTGLSFLEGTFMSAFVFAGASQLIVLDMWFYPLPVFTIIFTTFAVNLRHILMGASLHKWLSKLSKFWAYFSLFFMVDESWAITFGEMDKKSTKGLFLLGSGLLAFVSWVGSTIVGLTFGGLIVNPEKWALDFAFTAVFIALLAGLWKGKKDIPSWLIAAITAVIVSIFLPGKWYIISGGIIGGLVGVYQNGN